MTTAPNQNGDVVIKLGKGESEREVTLVCSPRALRRVSDTFGGTSEAISRLVRFDFSAYLIIVAAGLSTKAKPVMPGDIEEDVYGAGMVALSKPLSDWVSLLSNGGKPVEEDKKEGDDKEGEE